MSETASMFETAYADLPAAAPDPRFAPSGAGKRRTETDWEALAAKIGPGSMLGRAMADRRANLFVLMSAAVQAGQPEVSRLLVAHGTIFADPWTRGIDTLAVTDRMFFEDPVRAGRAVRELHRDLGGTREDGRPLHPWYEPAWTHCALSTAWGFFTAGEWLRPDMTAAERYELFDGCMAFCRLVGVSERLLPADIDGFIGFNLGYCETEMQRTEAMELLAEMGRDVPAPGRVPGWAWRPVGRVVSRVVKLLACGPLPTSARQILNMPWGPRERLEYRMLMGALRLADHLPEHLRTRRVARVARSRWLAEHAARVAAAPSTLVV